MPEARKDIIQPVTAEAIGMARMLLRTARFAALATLAPGTGRPMASRVSTATDIDGTPVILVSSLAPHTSALEKDPRCSLLIGEPKKGDPLAHPRISILCDATKLDGNSEDGRRARSRFLNRHPKAALYADFTDFSYFRMEIGSASLNGGFARAYLLDRSHLLLSPQISATFAGAEQAAIDHINKDHSDTVRLLAAAGGKPQSANWKLTGIDPEGLDLAYADNIRRITFPKPLSSPDDIRPALIELFRTVQSGYSAQDIIINVN